MEVKLKIGQIVQGVVTGIQPYGAFVMLEGDYTGLVHISEISERYVRNIEDFIQIGDVIAVRILELDDLNLHAKLSLKKVIDTPRVIRRRANLSWRQRRNDLEKKQELFPALSRTIQTLLAQEEERRTLHMIHVDLTATSFSKTIFSFQEQVTTCHQAMVEKQAKGSDFLGWYDLPLYVSPKDILRIQQVAERIRTNSKVLVICGIGGSYIGIHAAKEMLYGLYGKTEMEVVYLGNTLSPMYTQQVLEYLADKDFAVNVISKSGTTTESAIGFRLLQQLLVQKYGKEGAKQRIVATTDQTKGALKTMADQEGYETFVIPDNIGGRYSILTPVGLFPLAVIGVDIRQMLQGARQAYGDFISPDLKSNTAYQYAVVRHLMYQEGKSVELFVSYEPQFRMFAEWWKQLFGESEGKEGKGLFPASVTYTTDLHSLGQFIQDGKKVLFETNLIIKNPMNDLAVPFDEQDLDGLNYLAGKSLHEVNQKAFLGTYEAHSGTGNVPNIIIELPDLTPFAFGYLVQFFMVACAMSCYLLDVNPFNQPGVEIYKKNMFSLLGKYNKKG